jgi:hypothetical protein
MAINKGYLTAKTDKASDEYYTPKLAVSPLLPYLADKKYTIWCPFDDETSEYVQCFKEQEHNVIATHIDSGQNFFTYEPEEEYDIIISNPPFSLKDDILKRLNELNKPYAILLPLPTLQGQKRFPYLENSQALIFDKRINFYTDTAHTQMAKGVAFASIYICKNFLPKDLIFTKL